LRRPRGEPRGLLRKNLGDAYLGCACGDHGANQEKALGAYEAALAVMSDTSPDLRAETQYRLALLLQNRSGGSRADNLEKAIAAYEETLKTFTRKDAPEQWAGIQGNLGVVYSDRVRGVPDENLEKAISAHEAALTVWTREAEFSQ
jgi:tetratricopeptide (TPR) repeat protein